MWEIVEERRDFTAYIPAQVEVRQTRGGVASGKVQTVCFAEKVTVRHAMAGKPKNTPIPLPSAPPEMDPIDDLPDAEFGLGGDDNPDEMGGGDPIGGGLPSWVDEVFDPYDAGETSSSSQDQQLRLVQPLWPNGLHKGLKLQRIIL